MADPEHTRDLALRRIYGITIQEYKAILAAQGHRCPVCLKPLEGLSNPVDHDHVTGVIRGILCTYDNRRRIGQHREWEIVQRMADYLRHYPAGRVIGPRRVPPKKKKRRNSVTDRTKPAPKRPRAVS